MPDIAPNRFSEIAGVFAENSCEVNQVILTLDICMGLILDTVH